MDLSKEHILAIKISIFLFIFAIFLSNTTQFFNQNYMMWNAMWWWMWNWFHGQYKYYIVIFLSVFIYLISYFLAKITIKPIEENNKFLKEYNHNLAHEIKTPLTVIMSNLELLELWYDEKIIKSSIEEVKNIKDITNNLLFLSESNEIVDKKNISLKEILENIKNDEININIKNDFIIFWNEILIQRLVNNLVENALKYNIWNEKIKIFLDKNKFKICNKTDIKIDNSETEKLFETFYKADNSSKSFGYWLWLSIVKKITIAHNLKINISLNNNIFCVKITKK